MEVLLVGETWVNVTTEIKGFDSFTFTHYKDSSKWLREALAQGGYRVEHLPCHAVADSFPNTLESMARYGAIIFSDIGSNTFLLTRECAEECKAIPDRLSIVREYVRNGGAFCMIGGWMSFQGMDAKAHYKYTPIAEVLPVEMLDGDDRVEVCSGLTPRRTNVDHKITSDLPEEWPAILSYNKLIAREEGVVLASGNGDPLVVVGQYGAGRVAVTAFDCAPHGAPYEFLKWEGYPRLWNNIVSWLTSKE